MTADTDKVMDLIRDYGNAREDGQFSESAALIRELEALLHDERDHLAAQVDRVRALCLASDDGTEHEHQHRHPEGPGHGEPTCPACWVADIRAALDGGES